MNGKLYSRSGEELGRCTYCMKVGRKKNLKPIPKVLDDKQIGVYCPYCYPEVLAEVKKFPWNKGKVY